MPGKIATGTWKDGEKLPQKRLLALVHYKQKWKDEVYEGYTVIVYDPELGWRFGMDGVKVIRWAQINTELE